MAAIKYNVKGVEGSRPVPKPAVYACKLVECEHVKREDKADMIRCVYEITEKGDYKGHKLRDWIVLDEASEWKLAQFIEAMGLPEEGKLDPKKVVGTALSIRTRIENSDEYGPQARPATLLALDSDADEDEDLSDDDDDDDTADDDDGDDDSSDDEDDDDDDDEDEDEDEAGDSDDDEDDDDDETYSKEELEDLSDEDLIDVAFGYTDEDGDEIDPILDVDEVDKSDYVTEKTSGKGKKKKVTAELSDREGLITAVLEAQGGDENDAPDYDGMDVKDLRKLAKERKLETKGSKKVLVARLQKDDEPF